MTGQSDGFEPGLYYQFWYRPRFGEFGVFNERRGREKKNNNNSNNSLPFLGTEELKNIDRNTIQLMSKR